MTDELGRPGPRSERPNPELPSPDGKNATNGTPWQARLAASVLTERGLATLLSLVLVGFLIWGMSRLIDDVRAVGQQQVAQQERIIIRLDEANAHLRRIEVYAAGLGVLLPTPTPTPTAGVR